MKKDNLKVLFIDFSTTNLGYAYWSRDKGIHLTGAIGGSGKDTLTRADNILFGLPEVIADREIDPDILVIEEMNTSRNMKTTRETAMAIGALINQMNFDLSEVRWLNTPHWRKLAYGGYHRGEDLKQKAIDTAESFGIEVSSHDQAEAICQCLAWCNENDEVFLKTFQ